VVGQGEHDRRLGPGAAGLVRPRAGAGHGGQGDRRRRPVGCTPGCAATVDAKVPPGSTPDASRAPPKRHQGQPRFSHRTDQGQPSAKTRVCPVQPEQVRS
jgi:hypothetical protein